MNRQQARSQILSYCGISDWERTKWQSFNPDQKLLRSLVCMIKIFIYGLKKRLIY
ncbi:hypothetical protein PLAN_120374 [Planktothrix rubescens CCAP 1459/22]|uniref:Uncharacterized protein n=1 Tax=Planktothrix rubescens CCAP 1459/22 TaxID=329571 RepID=A0A6J7ZJ25_PLARU|nr:hypothetical protein PLAN_120374 [Planktothrix rubescens NIVA-CYA 18]